MTPPSTPHSGAAGFPVLVVAILGIAGSAFLLVGYCIFVTKCCFRWWMIDPLRRFSIRPAVVQANDDPLTLYYSPSWQSRGLDEALIREIPTFQYGKRPGSDATSLSKCVVCFNEFQEDDVLRVLPKCSHAFHLDCIDVWLQSNSNCPLCRSSISGKNRCRVERIVAPNSSPQEQRPTPVSLLGGQEDFVVIEISGEDGNRHHSGQLLAQPQSCSSRKFDLIRITKSKPSKSHHASIMGDEGIDVREKDEQFSIQPIRRSFSMDSAAERDACLFMQEILHQNTRFSEVRNAGESSRSSPSCMILSTVHAFSCTRK